MSMRKKPLLTPEEQERIRQAVREAEQRTSGEIVPYIVYQSDDYEVAYWRGGLLGMLLGMVLASGIYLFYTGWGMAWLHTPWGLMLFLLGLGAVSMGAVHGIPRLKRWMAGQDNIVEQVHKRAMVAFVEEEVFNTRDRTGILIFVSLFERWVEIIGDAGINAKVSPSDWVAIVQHIRQGLRQGRLADALVEAIRECGELLERAGVAIRAEDTNELSNRPRLSDT